ncbi:MAG: RnfABCDGE type electron transport complex subunit D [Bacteroidales bacterium]|nr:RnfABCDGE type electron transport complex subunit D [Bacteroidales bacterium]
MNNLTIAPSPHVHSSDSVKRNMYLVVAALLPALIASVYYFGLGALSVVVTSIVSCVLIEFLIQKFVLKVPTTITDGSAAVTGLILSFNLPAGLPLWIVVVGALVAIGIGKMTFGGLGQNIANPAILGRVFLLVSFPAQMTTWPVPQGADGATGATPLGLLKEGGVGALANIPTSDLLFGNIGGSLGEISALLLIIGGIILLVTRVITWHIPVSILATVAIFAGLMWGVDPTQYADPLFHILTGGMLLGAIFMATDYVTSPMSHSGMIVYGVGIGLITMLIRTFGAYPEGMSFAILIMNIVTPLINTYCKPKRFGEVVKK